MAVCRAAFAGPVAGGWLKISLLGGGTVVFTPSCRRLWGISDAKPPGLRAENTSNVHVGEESAQPEGREQRQYRTGGLDRATGRRYEYRPVSGSAACAGQLRGSSRLRQLPQRTAIPVPNTRTKVEKFPVSAKCRIFSSQPPPNRRNPRKEFPVQNPPPTNGVILSSPF